MEKEKLEKETAGGNGEEAKEGKRGEEAAEEKTAEGEIWKRLSDGSEGEEDGEAYSSEEPRRTAQRRDAGSTRLGLRDRQVLMALAVARYLSTEQLTLLFFPNKDGTSCTRRLRQLAGTSKTRAFAVPLVRRLQYRTFDGSQLVSIWALTDVGYSVVERKRGVEQEVPRKDVGVEYRAHCIALNALFVGLALPFLRAGELVERLPFRWRPSESVRLPWTQYEAETQRRRDRLIIPDAVLELPVSRRRLFIECEMGTHPVASGNDRRAGATVAKAESYEEFVCGLRDGATKETFYERSYPDRWRADVLFLVQTAGRRKTVNEALLRSRGAEARESLPMRALFSEELVAELLQQLPAKPTRAAAPKVTAHARLLPAHVEAVKDFYQVTLRALHDALKRLNEKPAPGVTSAAARAREAIESLRTMLPAGTTVPGQSHG